VRADRGTAVRNGGISGRRRRTWNRHERCIHRHPTHPDQRPLRQQKQLLTKSAITPAAEVGHTTDGLIGTALKKTHP
jgi:hypothetical protein